MRSKNTALCPECRHGTILTGTQKQYNAKSKDGKDICPDCKLNEIIHAASCSLEIHI